MPSLTETCYYAMYVIGEVESNWTWTSVYYADPITIGLIQMYGEEAARFMSRMQAEDAGGWALLAQTLKDDLASHGTGEWWNSRYLTEAEGNSWIQAAQSQVNHALQEDHAIKEFADYVGILQKWGFSLDRPKPLIFAMSMYHQAPNWAGQVVASCGGDATLQTIYTTCMNHQGFSRYSNRYRTNYERLSAWDGQSAPPDFGQTGQVSTLPGGNSGISEIASKLSHIDSKNDLLILYGKDELASGVVFYPVPGQTWVVSRNVNGTEIEGGWSGGGTATGSQAAAQVVALFKSWEDRFAYSRGPGRLDPLTSGYGDCSSTIWKAYQMVSGIDVGTWTGEMVEKGTLIAEGGQGQALPVASMAPGDLFLIQRNGNPTYSHVELYCGDNVLWGHGGPDDGPDLTTTDAAAYPLNHTLTHWQVRRYV